jgi:1-acyl-sn-glycerol-3-phosphate acyltransferase
VNGIRRDRVPALPPNIPRRGNAFTRLLGNAYLAAVDWRLEGEFPDRAKLLAIVAPHTSNWDFPLGIAVVYALGLRVRFLAKHTLFGPWIGWLMRWFGGTPVIREAPQGAVAQVVELFEREPAIFLAVTPAGTRRKGTPWRSGFYHMAHAARVPILPIAFDAELRAIRLFAPFETSGDYEADLPRLQKLFEGIRGLKP